MCGFRVARSLWSAGTTRGVVEGQLVVLVLLGLPQNALIAGRLESRLRLDEMPRPLVVEGAGREGGGAEGRQVGQVHAGASRLGGLEEEQRRSQKRQELQVHR